MNVLIQRPNPPRVGVIMGSQTDWATMSHAVNVLQELDIAHEGLVISAHRTPDMVFKYASSASGRGLSVIIAGAGGAAHLPAMIASATDVPVLGVPVRSHALGGFDSLLSIVQMPPGVAVATFAIGEAGAVNAALLAAQILALGDAELLLRLKQRRSLQSRSTQDVAP